MCYFLDFDCETSLEPSFRGCGIALNAKDVKFLHFLKIFIFEIFFTTISTIYVKNTSEKKFYLL